MNKGGTSRLGLLAKEKTQKGLIMSGFVKIGSAIAEEKSNMSQPIRDQGCHFLFSLARKTQTW